MGLSFNYSVCGRVIRRDEGVMLKFSIIDVLFRRFGRGVLKVTRVVKYRSPRVRQCGRLFIRFLALTVLVNGRGITVSALSITALRRDDRVTINVNDTCTATRDATLTRHITRVRSRRTVAILTALRHYRYLTGRNGAITTMRVINVGSHGQLVSGVFHRGGNVIYSP